MIAAIGLVIGAAWGAFLARKRGGKPLDMLQYAAGFGLAFAVAGMFAGILLLRLF